MLAREQCGQGSGGMNEFSSKMDSGRNFSDDNQAMDEGFPTMWIFIKATGVEKTIRTVPRVLNAGCF